MDIYIKFRVLFWDTLLTRGSLKDFFIVYHPPGEEIWTVILYCSRNLPVPVEQFPAHLSEYTISTHHLFRPAWKVVPFLV